MGPDDPFAGLSPSAARSHYLEWGFVVVRGLVRQDRCTAVIRELARIKEISDPLDRFQSHHAEPHRFDEKRRIRNPLRGVHRLRNPSALPFAQACRDILDERSVATWIDQLSGERMVMSETFYFETNNATEPHQDLAYNPGLRKVVAAWVALETISVEAGRFYVYAGSQSYRALGGEGHYGDDEAARQYHAAVREAIAQGTWSLHAPAVQRGDVIFFDGASVHGALPTTDPDLTRHSLTAHWIPANLASLVREPEASRP